MHAISAVTKAISSKMITLESLSSSSDVVVSLLVCISDDAIMRVRPLARLSVIIISDILPVCYSINTNSNLITICLKGLLVALYHHEKPSSSSSSSSLSSSSQEVGGFIPFAVKQDHIAAVSILKVADIIYLKSSSSSSSPSSSSSSSSSSLTSDILNKFIGAISMLNSLSIESYEAVSTFISNIINMNTDTNTHHHHHHLHHHHLNNDYLSALLVMTYQKLVTKYNDVGYITEKSGRLLVSASSVALATAVYRSSSSTDDNDVSITNTILIMSPLLAPLVTSIVMILEKRNGSSSSSSSRLDQWLQSLLKHDHHHHAAFKYISSILANNCTLGYLLWCYKDALVEAHKCYSSSSSSSSSSISSSSISQALVHAFSLPILEASINRISIFNTTTFDDEYDAICKVLSSSVSLISPIDSTSRLLSTLTEMAVKLVTMAATANMSSSSVNTNTIRYSITAASSVVKTIKLTILDTDNDNPTTLITANSAMFSNLSVQLLIMIFNTISSISITLINSSTYCDDTFTNVVGTTTTFYTTTTTTTTNYYYNTT